MVIFRVLVLAVPLIVSTAAWTEPGNAEIAEAKEELELLRAEMAKHERNIHRMREEVEAAKLERRLPRGEMLADHYATATGDRAAAYHEADKRIQAMIDEFEDNATRNIGDSIALMAGGANSRARFIVEIKRSRQFIDEFLKPRIAELEAQIEASQNPYLDDDLREMIAESEVEEAQADERDAEQWRDVLRQIQSETRGLAPRIAELERAESAWSMNMHRIDDQIETLDFNLDDLRARARDMMAFGAEHSMRVREHARAARDHLSSAEDHLKSFSGKVKRLESDLDHARLPPVCSGEAASGESVATLRILARGTAERTYQFVIARRQLTDAAAQLAEDREILHGMRLMWAKASGPLREPGANFDTHVKKAEALEAAQLEASKQAYTAQRLQDELAPQVSNLLIRLHAIAPETMGDPEAEPLHRELFTTLDGWQKALQRPIKVPENWKDEIPSLALDLQRGLKEFDELGHLEDAIVASIDRLNKAGNRFNAVHGPASAWAGELEECVAVIDAADGADIATAGGDCPSDALATARKDVERFQHAVASLGNANASSTTLKQRVQRVLDNRKIIEQRFLLVCQTASEGRANGFDPGLRLSMQKPAMETDSAWRQLSSDWQALQSLSSTSKGTASSYSELRQRKQRSPEIETLRRRAEDSLRSANADLRQVRDTACSDKQRRALSELSGTYDAAARSLVAYTSARGTLSADEFALLDTAEPYYEDGREKYRKAIACMKIIADGLRLTNTPAGPAVTDSVDCSDPKKPHVVDGAYQCPCPWKNGKPMVFHPPTQLCQTELFVKMYGPSMKLKRSLNGARDMGETADVPDIDRGQRDPRLDVR